LILVIHILTGGIGTYDVDVNETVDQLQTKIYNKERVPEDQQKLIYKGKGLESGKKLQDYNITSGDTIYMTLRLRGEKSYRKVWIRLSFNAHSCLFLPILFNILKHKKRLCLKNHILLSFSVTFRLFKI
uniref:Ubiquitin-like domain-containing protein n=1 Tax=Cyprinus carpio TaxID=7962 RepID=A0A8C1ZKD3_CYPCA